MYWITILKIILVWQLHNVLCWSMSRDECKPSGVFDVAYDIKKPPQSQMTLAQ